MSETLPRLRDEQKKQLLANLAKIESAPANPIHIREHMRLITNILVSEVTTKVD